MKKLAGSLLLVAVTAGFALAAEVNVGVRTPNVSVQVGTPQPAPHVTVIERERVIVKEVRRNNGRHKGHYKKHRKHDRYYRHN